VLSSRPEASEFYVGKLEADPEDTRLWGTHESEWSLYEVSEKGDPGPDLE
jgi:hypothetical protein